MKTFGHTSSAYWCLVHVEGPLLQQQSGAPGHGRSHTALTASSPCSSYAISTTREETNRRDPKIDANVRRRLALQGVSKRRPDSCSAPSMSSAIAIPCDSCCAKQRGPCPGDPLTVSSGGSALYTPHHTNVFFLLLYGRITRILKSWFPQLQYSIVHFGGNVFNLLSVSDHPFFLFGRGCRPHSRS
jgi:hypothetical protein